MKLPKHRLTHYFWVGIVWVAASVFMVPVSFAQGPASVSELAARLSGAVVNVGTSRQVQGGHGEPFPSLPPGSPLRDLFDELNPNSGQGEEAMREARSLGSGFVISEQGLIVTNNHVIAGADEILIYMDQGIRYVAELVGADEKTDLAVLKISADEPLPFVNFGNSDSAEVGDWVLAIGNPFGLGGSVSLGIVSARNRDINSGPYDDFIQTDAAINLGNSGGPLFDMDGNVIGIVTAIVARGGSSRGIGFAVPVNLAVPIIDQLTEFGETRRGWLGVGIQPVTEDIAASLGQSAPIGALVVEVTRGGPSQGILEPGDVIVLFDGNPIIETRDLPRIVAQTPVGTSSLVQVIRNRKMVEVTIKLGQLETVEKLVAATQQSEQNENIGINMVDDGYRLPEDVQQMLGFSIMPLTASVRRDIGRGSRAKGLLVDSVTARSTAFDMGMRSGLVLSHVGEIEVETVQEFERLLQEAQENQQDTLMLKLRDSSGIGRFVALPIQ